MIVRRRSWLYRLAGQRFVHSVSFDRPVTALAVRQLLKRTVGVPLELWARSRQDLVV